MTVQLPLEPSPFAVASAITPTGPGRFEADVDPNWTIVGKPNGGYLLAMLGRAATAVGDHDHVITASAVYVSTPDPGRVEIEADVLRAGRSASQVRTRLTQDGRACVEALLTTSHLDGSTRPYWERGLPRRNEVPFEECIRLGSTTPEGRQVAIMDQVELRLEPDSCGFMLGRPRGQGELRGWLRLLGDEPFDPASLLYAVDAFPPATFDIQMAGWVPTFELTVYVRALPAPGPLRILHRAHVIDGSRVDESCVVWDTTGRCVAQGTQLAGIRLG